MRKMKLSKRLGVGGPVYMTAVLEYLCAEVMELCGNSCRDNKRKRIIPRDLVLALRNDEELNKFLGKNTVISKGGVVPAIHQVLLAGGKGKKKKRSKNNDGGDGANDGAEAEEDENGDDAIVRVTAMDDDNNDEEGGAANEAADADTEVSEPTIPSKKKKGSKKKETTNNSQPAGKESMRMMDED